VTVSLGPAFQDPPEANSARKVQEGDGVAGGEANIEAPAEVPVHHPFVALHQLRHSGAPFLRQRNGPIGPPVVEVKMNYGKVEPTTKPSCERGLSSAARTDDQDAVHGFSP